MKKTKKIILSVATISMIGLSGVIQPMETTYAKTTVSTTQQQKLIANLQSEYNQFVKYGSKKLNDKSYVITSYNTASSILSSQDRKDYVTAYNKVKNAGLTNNATVKKIAKEYKEIVNYLEAVKYVTKYRNNVKSYSNSYKELLTEKEYKALGINDKTNTSKARGKALQEYNQYKKLVTTSSKKRLSSLQSMYSNATNFGFASHNINLANSQSLKTKSSISKAKSYITKAKSNVKSVTISTAKSTVNAKIKTVNSKIAKAEATLSSGSNSSSSNSNSSNSTTASSSVSAYEKEVVELVNAERAKEGLKALTLDTKLSSVARIKSEDMKKNNYFSHTSPTYGSPFEMMKQYGISYTAAGENIAMGQTTPSAVVTAWMNSSGHRANIMSTSFTHIGVGHESNGNYWTQMFIAK